MSATLTVPYYLRVSKTLDDRLKRFAAANPTISMEGLLSLGLMIHAMPDGATIRRKRGAILGVATETELRQEPMARDSLEDGDGSNDF